MCPRPGPFKGFFGVLAIFILCGLIFYQALLTFLLPFRFNLLILLIEIFILFYILWRIVWPY